ncbi:MAG TPA: SIR2 family protein [Fimbriimonas sp.]|nr:SIR2 family protein [Fimbriimonas sp.]
MTPSISIGTKVNKRCLLLGAGFSKNFGGYLGGQISDELLSDPLIQRYPKVHDLIKKYHNYEEALGIARKGGFTESELKQLTESIVAIYDHQNRIITDFDYQHPNQRKFFSTGRIVEFFTHVLRFKGQVDTSLIFTLNQDLFFEQMLRLNNQSDLTQIRIPGLNSGDYLQNDLKRRIHVDDTVENVMRSVQRVNGVTYIKLHGSADWYNKDGELLVIGSDKEDFIRQSPLLSAYRNIFEQACSVEGMKMLVIGYGFADNHINKILAEGIARGLRLYVWERMDRASWTRRLGNYGGKSKEELEAEHMPYIQYGEEILSGLDGYLTNDMAEVLVGHRDMPDRYAPTLDNFLLDDWRIAEMQDRL